MRAPDLELAYLFRHALMRDAVYQLQPPGDRARLHGLAADALEAIAGLEPDPAGAKQLATHLRLARGNRDSADLLHRELRFTRLAAEFADARFHHQDSLALWQRCAELDPARRADALRRAGRAAVQSGESAKAEPLLLVARDLAIASSDAQTEALAQGSLGNLYQQTGRLEEAEGCHLRAIELHRRLGNRTMEGIEISNLANRHSRARDHAQAEKLILEALVVHREVGNRLGEGVALSNLAALYEAVGRRPESEAAFGQAFVILRAVNDRRSIGIALANFGALLSNSERYAEAEEVFREALEVVRETGNRRFEAIVLGSLAVLYGDSEREPEAEAMFRRALDIHAEVQNHHMFAAHQCDHALCLLRLGRIDAARETWAGALLKLRATGDVKGVGFKVSEMQDACALAGMPAFEIPA